MAFNQQNYISGNYTDPQAILAEEEAVPCTFTMTATGLGFLDPGLNDDLPKGTRVELPLWLARHLARQKMVRMELPKHYQPAFRMTLSAGAEKVDLRSRSVYFYDAGTALAASLGDDELRKDVTDFKKIFSNEEQLLFEAGAAASASYMQWKAGNHGKIVASEAVASHVAKRARVG